MSRFSRNLKIVVLIIALALGYVLGAAQKRAAATGRPFFPEQVALVAIAPFERAFTYVRSPIAHLRRACRTRSRLQAENRRLRSELLGLVQENQRLREMANENARLREAIGFRAARRNRMVLARVIALQPSRRYDTCTLGVGTRHGVRRECAVVTPRGLVGRVIRTTPTTCQVLLLRDPMSSVGAMIERSRVTGICEGQQSDILLLNYLKRDADVRVGDIAITSGMGGVYPKGLTIGRVARIVYRPGDYLKSAEIIPSVRFDALEEAFVILD